MQQSNRRSSIRPTGVEVFFDAEEIIVSKTDLTGKLTYANQIFLKIAGYTEDEVLGMPHNIIRHPDMPRAVFALLWDTLRAGREVFAYVVNLTKTGDHYWVLAHVTPTFDHQGKISGYHSSRRLPHRQAIETMQVVYAALSAEERRHPEQRNGLAASQAMLTNHLAQAGMTYDEFIWTVAPASI